MSKLFKLKEWLTIPDAAKHLTIVFGEEVTETDVLQLIMDGEIPLSVYFASGLTVRKLKKYSFPLRGSVPSEASEAMHEEYLRRPHDLCYPIIVKPLDSGDISMYTWLPTDEIVSMPEGIYDPIIDSGSSDFDVRKRYWLLSSGIEVNHTNRSYLINFVRDAWWGAAELLSIAKDNKLKIADSGGDASEKKPIVKESFIGVGEIVKQQNQTHLLAGSNMPKEQERINYSPMYELPEDSFLIIRTRVLREFEHEIVGIPGRSKEKPLFLEEKYQ